MYRICGFLYLLFADFLARSLTALKHLGWPEMMPFKIRSLYSVCKWVRGSLVELPCMINYPKTAINMFSPLQKKKRPQWPWWQSKHLAGGVVTNHSDITKGLVSCEFQNRFSGQTGKRTDFLFLSFLLKLSFWCSSVTARHPCIHACLKI